MPRSPIPSRDALQQLLDGLQTFIREHLALARVEMKEDLRAMGRDVLTGAAGVPALATGYLLLMMAVAWLLAVWLPNWAAFGLVALFNLAAGGMLTYRGSRRVMSDRIGLQRTASEMKRDREWLTSIKDGPRPAESPFATAARPSKETQPGASPQ